MLTALLRHGGRNGHFLDKMVRMDNIVEGIQKWVELQDLANEATLGVQETMQWLLYPSDEIARFVVYHCHTDGKVWVGVYEADSINGAKRDSANSPQCYMYNGRQVKRDDRHRAATGARRWEEGTTMAE